ncbi:hypothetical protein Enr13x_64440 [Stieleria neptunia]|uniref:Uncharacterized protein n=1 Tax=Stieleria neptunia TaxID=2527979 RepID=A0A518I0A4_9BACT|nr:hypothetical protein Enr13x_64440 [Stieleria neptunia]
MGASTSLVTLPGWRSDRSEGRVERQGRAANVIDLDAQRSVLVSGRARALRSFSVFLKRDRTARAVPLTP